MTLVFHLAKADRICRVKISKKNQNHCDYLMESSMSETVNYQQKPANGISIYQRRQLRLGKLLQQYGLNAVVLNPGPTLYYLTGLRFHLMERPTVAILTPGQPLHLVIPQLEAAKTNDLTFPVRVHQYGEDPGTWFNIFQQAAQNVEIAGQVGVEPTRFRYLELHLMETAAPEANFISAEDCLAEIRLRKDAAELELMRRAVELAQKALENTLPTIRSGTTERQIAAELTFQLLKAGADPEVPFSPIVSAGPNSANPHATPTDRPIAEGDLLVIDWGAYYGGYCSDLTRTFGIEQVDPEMMKIAKIVQEANEAGRTVAQPGVPAETVDTAARTIIERAGYGAYFTHRTGHGLGMEGHEAPYIRAGNSMLLEPGMTFTVEPGIYLPGRNGVRIEDNVVITSDGSETLSTWPRELIIIHQ